MDVPKLPNNASMPNLIVCPLSQRSCQTEPLRLFHLATILLTPSKGKGKYHILND